MATNRKNAGKQGVLTRSYAGYSLGSLLIALGALAVMIATLTYGN